MVKLRLMKAIFGGHRKGKGRAAVFSLLKRQGKVFTVVLENTRISVW